MLRTALAATVLLLAGCLSPAADEGAKDGPLDQADLAASGAGRLPSADNAMVQPVEAPPAGPEPLLVSLTGELRRSAAELVVPPGEFRLVRLVYDAKVWNEKEPWDGDAEVVVGAAYRVEGDGVLMRAFGFEPPSFAEDRAIRPHLSFSPVSGEGWTASWTLRSCSGDCSIPLDQAAYLIGGPGGATLRLGILGSIDAEAEELWSRPALAVRPEATTRDAFAGLASRYLVLASEYEFQAGVLSATWDDAVAPGVSAARSSSYAAKVPITEPGILTVGLAGRETAGEEEWSYSLQAPGLAGGWSGAWVHDPQSLAIYLTLTGMAYPPRVSAQGNVGAGELVFEAERTFTAVSDPTGLGSLSYESVMLGHAGVDLDALYGWETAYPPSPSDGALLCEATSLLPDVRTCFGQR